MAFVTPIIDRTQADVLYAIINQNSVSDLKGALNISDINRIINNSIYLRDLLIANGFTPSFLNQSLFIETDIPSITSKIDVIRDNVRTLVNSFYTLNNPTITYGNTLNYNDINIIENNILITNSLLQGLINELKLCGYTTCGEDIQL